MQEEVEGENWVKIACSPRRVVNMQVFEFWRQRLNPTIQQNLKGRLKDEEWERNKYYNKMNFFSHKKMKAKKTTGTGTGWIWVEKKKRFILFFLAIKSKTTWLKRIQETTRWFHMKIRKWWNELRKGWSGGLGKDEVGVEKRLKMSGVGMKTSWEGEYSRNGEGLRRKHNGLRSKNEKMETLNYSFHIMSPKT